MTGFQYMKMCLFCAAMVTGGLAVIGYGLASDNAEHKIKIRRQANDWAALCGLFIVGVLLLVWSTRGTT